MMKVKPHSKSLLHPQQLKIYEKCMKLKQRNINVDSCVAENFIKPLLLIETVQNHHLKKKTFIEILLSVPIMGLSLQFFKL